jgi:hypothetical protein
MKAVRVTKSEWRPEFNKYVCKARRVARKHRAYIEMVARLLTEKGTLTDAEIPLIEDVQCWELRGRKNRGAAALAE